MRNTWIRFEIEKISLFKTSYDIAILFMRYFKFDLGSVR